jgi:hypothetical protein
VSRSVSHPVPQSSFSMRPHFYLHVDPRAEERQRKREEELIKTVSIRVNNDATKQHDKTATDK